MNGGMAEVLSFLTQAVGSLDSSDNEKKTADRDNSKGKSPLHTLNQRRPGPIPLSVSVRRMFSLTLVDKRGFV